jgi:hypothetical protein
MQAHKNQKAHEVTRDVTAWACLVFLRTNSLWYRADSSASGFRPGPASAHSAQHRPFKGATLHRRFPALHRAGARPTGRRGGFPTGRPWVFAKQQHPSRTTICIAANRTRERLLSPYPDPFLGSAWLLRPLLADPGLRMGPTPRCATTLSSRALMSLAAILARLATELLSSLVSGSPIAGRRPRPYPQLLASHGSLFSWGRSP